MRLDCIRKQATTPLQQLPRVRRHSAPLMIPLNSETLYAFGGGLKLRPRLGGFQEQAGGFTGAERLAQIADIAEHSGAIAFLQPPPQRQAQDVGEAGAVVADA